MPQIFNNAVITDSGRALLSKEMTGECMIQITRMSIGSGIYTDIEKEPDMLQKMTMLKNERQSVGLSSLKRQDDTSVIVTGVFTNDNLDAAYNINEIGLFAQEKGSKSTEILYAIAVIAETEGEVMPAGEGKNPVRIIQDWIVTVSNSANATIESLPDGAFAMAADVGNVDELDTQEKGDLVKAVNETLRRLIITDTSGVLGKKEAEVEAQDLLDEIADKVMQKLLLKTGDSENCTVTFENSDTKDAKSWTNVDVLEKNETHKSLFGKMSTMFKNVRFLYKMLGTTDISKLGDGTVTGVIQDFKTAIDKKVNFTDVSQSAAVTVPGKKALDAIEKNSAINGTMAHDISQIYSNLEIQIYDFETENPFMNDVTYTVRESAWYPQNKIYKFGRVCWLTLGVDTTNVTISNRILKIATLPDEFTPLSMLSADNPTEYNIGFYPAYNYIYFSDRNTEKYPNWSDATPAEGYAGINFVYISKK